jgi:hypothetical protein
LDIQGTYTERTWDISPIYFPEAKHSGSRPGLLSLLFAIFVRTAGQVETWIGEIDDGNKDSARQVDG